MVKVTAKALPIDYQYPHGSDVLRIEYSLGNLTVYVEGLANEPSFAVEFEDVQGFRVLDERDLMEYWPVCSTPNGWLFEITIRHIILKRNHITQFHHYHVAFADRYFSRRVDAKISGEISCPSKKCQN